MNRSRWVLLGLVLLGLLSACEATLPVAEETPQSEIIELQVTPAVEHWLPLVAACAQDIPGLGIYIQILPRIELSLDESDVVLRLGERLESDQFVAVMGIEEIVVVGGQDVPVSSLSLESLQALYAGEITRWGDVQEAGTGQAGGTAPIKLLAYPAGHEIEILFNRGFLNDEPNRSAPQTYLTVEFLQKLLDMYPTGIGYLLESQVPQGMRILPITADQPIPSGQYVLAVTAQDPDGRLKALLTCLQSVQ